MSSIKIIKQMELEYDKAITSLARYKFFIFGYHAANWVNLNKLLFQKQPNPFRFLVQAAKLKKL